ncbi:unnamed protein product [Blepharisma stoltei]|uniref:RING-type domain-containing protein n=1 Tax=Blepharisma stoltei TaxID=1481888 RepID=A0AAU9INR5_9CILI|nr:unnamed protein product [Blepharisma stoltei]
MANCINFAICELCNRPRNVLKCPCRCDLCFDCLKKTISDKELLSCPICSIDYNSDDIKMIIEMSENFYPRLLISECLVCKTRKRISSFLGFFIEKHRNCYQCLDCCIKSVRKNWCGYCDSYIFQREVSWMSCILGIYHH